jgi:8-oxo-dGTP pyrophosphatase MutT (NUDIX family)
MAHDRSIAAGLVLRRPAGSGWRWLLLRGRGHGEWGFPKGHLDPGETPWQAALRECAEETGIATVVAEGRDWELHYLLPSGRPKTVHYFPARTRSEAVVLSDEHSEFRWTDAKGTLALLPHENIRVLFRAVIGSDQA